MEAKPGQRGHEARGPIQTDLGTPAGGEATEAATREPTRRRRPPLQPRPPLRPSPGPPALEAIVEVARTKGDLARSVRDPIPGLDPCLAILDAISMTEFLDARILTNFL